MPFEDLDVERVGQVSWIDEGMVIGGRGRDMYAAARKRVRKHRNHRDEVAWIRGGAGSGKGRCIGVPLAKHHEEGRARSGQEIFVDERALVLEAWVRLGCRGEESLERGVL